MTDLNRAVAELERKGRIRRVVGEERARDTLTGTMIHMMKREHDP